MALIDVTDVLLDPDFIDSGLVCERLEQIVGDNGIASNMPSEIEFAGVVIRDTSLERTPTGERIVGSIMIHTQFLLRDGEDGFTADVVQWKGRRYTVAEVGDRSNFGRGFCSAKCDLIPLSG
jgi:hypothetical protein